MTDNLEVALRRAVGLELTDANGDAEDPLPATPIALNDDESLRAIVLHGIKNGAALDAARKTHDDALEAISAAANSNTNR
jgi:hypothetical protein